MKKPETVISDAEDFLNIGNNREVKNIFLEKYTKCEILCWYYVFKFKNITGDDKERIELDLRTIKNALSEMGYTFEDKKMLTRIFGESAKKDSSSCRFLRNKITHELMERALNEVVERKDELFSDMDRFIETFINDKEEKLWL